MGYETYEKQVPGREEKENVGKAEDAHDGDGSEAFVRRNRATRHFKMATGLFTWHHKMEPYT